MPLLMDRLCTASYVDLEYRGDFMPTVMVDSKGKDVVAAFDKIEIKTKHGEYEATVEGVLYSKKKFVFGEHMEIIPLDELEDKETNIDEQDVYQRGDYVLLRVNTTKKK